MKTFGDRVRERREELGMSQESLGKAAGISQSTIAQIERGRNQGTKHILSLARALSVSAEWLETGRGSKHNSAPAGKSKKGEGDGLFDQSNRDTAHRLDEEELLPPTEEEFAYVYQLDIAAACGNGRFEDHVVVKGGLAFKKSFLRDKGVPEHAARIIYASGGSMSPTLQDGCVVLLNLADTEPRDGKVYAICKPDDGLVLKRLIWDFHPAVGRQTWIMRSDNPDKIAHPDKLLPPDDRTMIAGRAVWNDNQL